VFSENRHAVLLAALCYRRMMTPLVFAVEHIRGVSAEKQMLRVNAGWIVAMVANF
jgi:hypothetical protein